MSLVGIPTNGPLEVVLTVEISNPRDWSDDQIMHNVSDVATDLSIGFTALTGYQNRLKSDRFATFRTIPRTISRHTPSQIED